MSKQILRHRTALLTCATGILLISGSAGAGSFVQNATGACQSALPVFDGQIRKRPLTMQNEGTAPAFVSCSFMSTDQGIGGSRSIGQVTLYADNNAGSAVELTCTLIDGYSGGVATYFPMTRTLPPYSKHNEFFWYSGDDDDDNFFRTVNASCNLPVGTGLSEIEVDY